MKCKNQFASIDTFRRYRNQSKRRYYRKTAFQGSHRWTEEEKQMVLEHKIPDMQLSAQICHSVAAIQKMRSKMKKQLQIDTTDECS